MAEFKNKETIFKKEATDYKGKLEESDPRYAEQVEVFSKTVLKEEEFTVERATWMA